MYVGINSERHLLPFTIYVVTFLYYKTGKIDYFAFPAAIPTAVLTATTNSPPSTPSPPIVEPIKNVEDDEKGNLENGDSDSHQHPDGHRHLARRNELHVSSKSAACDYF